MEKKFSQMTDSEFRVLKKSAMGTYSEAVGLPDKYMIDLATQQRQRVDKDRYNEDMLLNDAEIMKKIKAEIIYEKKQKEIKQFGYPDWEKLLRTKLFNQPKI